jgi:hypothetical protein
MATGILIPVLGSTSPNRRNVLAPGGVPPLQLGLSRGAYAEGLQYVWLGAAAYYNPTPPGVGQVFNLDYPAVGGTARSLHEYSASIPAETLDKRPWALRIRDANGRAVTIDYEWAKGYGDPTNVPVSAQARYYWIVISVASPDDVYSLDPGGFMFQFRIGTVYAEGNFAAASAAWATI